MQQRIFIGSSSESLDIANAIADNLARDHEPTVWNQGIFAPSRAILTNLVSGLDNFDAAVFVLSPDDMTRIRGAVVATARDNVIFELGMFIGRLGLERTFYVIPTRHEDAHFPTDLLGIVPVTYPCRSDGNLNAALSSACNIIRKALEINQRLSTSPQTERLLLFPEAVTWLYDYVNRALALFLTGDVAGLLASRVKGVEGELRSEMGRLKIYIRFGRIEDCDASNAGCAVALPANEFFDDECIKDTRSALGSYIQHEFPNRIDEIQAQIREGLTGSKTEQVESEPDRQRPSYGIGKCVYLDGPLSSGRRILLVSVTTKRAGVGLHSEARYLFAATKALCQTMNDHRLTDLHLPVMGSGHGALEGELALLYLLLAFKAAVDTRLAIRLKSISIVVFQKDKSSEPSIPKDVAARILSVATATR